jgi:hypothetical protein
MNVPDITAAFISAQPGYVRCADAHLRGARERQAQLHLGGDRGRIACIYLIQGLEISVTCGTLLVAMSDAWKIDPNAAPYLPAGAVVAGRS